MNCPECQSPIKTVPAGVSKKTGKPYDSFQCCSNRECGWKPAKKANPSPSPIQGTASPVIDLLKRNNELLAKILSAVSKTTTVEPEELEPDSTTPF